MLVGWAVAGGREDSHGACIYDATVLEHSFFGMGGKSIFLAFVLILEKNNALNTI